MFEVLLSTNENLKEILTWVFDLIINRFETEMCCKLLVNYTEVYLHGIFWVNCIIAPLDAI